MQYIGYFSFRLIAGIFAIMPFWLVYRLSDLLYLLLYYVVGYRRKVVRDNLSKCFPEWDKKQLIRTEKRYYRHLSDIFVEGIKAIHLSESETAKRYKILTLEAPNEPYRRGTASLFVGSHYNNWEYGALGCGIQVDAPVVIFFKPLKNNLINNYIRNARLKKGSTLAPLGETAAFFESELPKKSMFIMLSDQNPSNRKEAHWVSFFGRNTPVLHGTAKYAHKYNLPIYFFKTRKAKRGFYELSGEVLVENPLDYSQYELTLMFMQKIEDLIREAPEYWLWSHKRWKNID